MIYLTSCTTDRVLGHNAQLCQVVNGVMVRPIGVGPAAGDASQRSRLRVIISEGRNREVQYEL